MALILRTEITVLRHYDNIIFLRGKLTRKKKKKKKKKIKPGMVAHAFNPSTWEAEAGRFLSLRPGLQSEFQDSQKPCLEQPNGGIETYG
jgi:hypothetical protein